MCAANFVFDRKKNPSSMALVKVTTKYCIIVSALMKIASWFHSYRFDYRKKSH